MLALQVANTAIGGMLSHYYDAASQRSSTTLVESHGVDRMLHLYRGMCHFEPAQAFLEPLRSAGLHPLVFRLKGAEERYLLNQWPLITTRAIQAFIEEPEDIGPRPVFAGHSAGGFTAFVLGAMAKGADLAAIRRTLPGLDETPLDKLEELAEQLRSGLFIGIGAPFNGVQLTRTGRLLHRTLLEERDPVLVRSLTRNYLRRFYRTIGITPAEVMDGLIVSHGAPLQLTHQPKSLVVNALVQGGMRFFGHLVEHDIYDGIVPVEAATLPEIPEEILSVDHLRLVETREAGITLRNLIAGLRTSLN